MTKAERRRLHEGINALTHKEVAEIIRRSFPRARGARIDAMAKSVISNAHRQVSPRQNPRG